MYATKNIRCKTNFSKRIKTSSTFPIWLFPRSSVFRFRSFTNSLGSTRRRAFPRKSRCSTRSVRPGGTRTKPSPWQSTNRPPFRHRHFCGHSSSVVSGNSIASAARDSRDDREAASNKKRIIFTAANFPIITLLTCVYIVYVLYKLHIMTWHI